MKTKLMAQHLLNFEIPASPAYAGIVRSAVTELARNLGFEESEADELKLAVGEALSNAIEHSSPDQEAKSVGVVLAVIPGGILVEISNSARPHCFPELPTCPNLRKERGYGLFLMGHMVDQLDVVSGAKVATVRMIKRMRPQPKPASTT
jgi:serine/threonine-protein kinase RsbW